MRLTVRRESRERSILEGMRGRAAHMMSHIFSEIPSGSICFLALRSFPTKPRSC